MYKSLLISPQVCFVNADLILSLADENTTEPLTEPLALRIINHKLTLCLSI